MGKIPDNAIRVFKGLRYELYQWQQRMFDGSEQTFEMIKRADTVEALVVVGDKILIQEEEQPHVPQPFYSLPGGCIDAGEDPLAATQRELREETGYEAPDWELFITQEPLQSVEWTMYVYIGRGAQKVTEPHVDGGERITSRLVSLEELLDLIDSGEMYRFEQTLRFTLLRAKYNPAAREELRKRIFGHVSS